MPYTLTNTKKLIKFHEDVSKFLQSKDILDLPSPIITPLESACRLLRSARDLHLMGQGRIAEEDYRNRVAERLLPGIEDEESDMELSTVDKKTGEVKSASINSKDIPKILKTIDAAGGTNES